MSSPYDGLSREQLVESLTALNERLAEAERRVEESKAENEWLLGSIRKRTDELNERVKELTCLYRLSTLLKAEPVDLGAVARLLPQAFLKPQRAAARIEANGRRYDSPGFDENGKILKRGAVAVSYPAGDPTQFLREEEQLLVEVSARLDLSLG